ncbi:Cytochrome b-c1 complex subunit 6-1 [Cardamine amara subsp. amara]|uniref:Complex III subunit VI n=1 Tax=Cardamine amara subsp. amara TaxID=228776 RepID=A0ABD1ANB7_CARAN
MLIIWIQNPFPEINIILFLSDFLSSLSSSLSNFAMAEEEAFDQKSYLEESCKPKCVKPLLDYQACVKRIQDDESGHKHCTGQYFDFWHCVDKCVGPKLFANLK